MLMYKAVHRNSRRVGRPAVLQHINLKAAGPKNDQRQCCGCVEIFLPSKNTTTAAWRAKRAEEGHADMLSKPAKPRCHDSSSDQIELRHTFADSSSLISTASSHAPGEDNEAAQEHEFMCKVVQHTPLLPTRDVLAKE